MIARRVIDPGRTANTIPSVRSRQQLKRRQGEGQGRYRRASTSSAFAISI
jgi:hypothetical protein